MDITMKCIHCASSTIPTSHTIRSDLGLSTIILHQAPMYYCNHCKENLMSAEAEFALEYIKKLPLGSGKNVFYYSDIRDKLLVLKEAK